MKNGLRTHGSDPSDETPDGLDALPPPSRNFAATRKVLLSLVAISVLVPGLCLAGYGYYDYQRRYADSVAASERASRVAEEQARKVMDLNAELVSRVEELLGNGTDAQVRNNEGAIHAKLNAVAGGFPQVAAVSAFGNTGDLLVSSRFFPVPRINIGTRDDFVVARRFRHEQYISRPLAASVSGTSVFNIAKARSAPDGTFLGTVGVAIRRDYMVGFYQKLTQEDDESFIGLYRSDGTLLASYPDAPNAVGSLTFREVSDALSRNGAGGHVLADRLADKEQRVVVYRRVGPYPLLVAAGFLVGQLSSSWLQHFLLILALTGAPCVAIWALLGFSLRQLAAEERGWQRWRAETLRRLDAEASGRHLQRMGALGNLVANVAHEFNNHLMAVKSNMAIARANGFRDVEEQVNAVERTTHSVEALVRTLMGATRKQPVRLTQVNLADALPKLGPVLQAAVGDAISVSINVPPDIWTVYCDVAELELAAINLAINARDAMPQGGTFAVRAQNVKVESDLDGVAAGDYVLVTASDNGMGMTASVAGRAFEPLFTTKQKGTAAGLGLAQVQAFCELSGGTAKITSAPAAGTTLRLYLPKAVLGDAPRPQPASVTSVGAHASVLLVEDNQEVAEGLAAVLEIMGHDVTHLASADEALRALQAGEEFALVLSDVQMPGELNGIELAEWLKTNRPKQPVALMTGYADELERARRTGVPIFAKPFDAQELAPLIS